MLSGLSAETPLGRIVSIRAEEDKNVLKHFTKEQNRIRNEWRNSTAQKMDVLTFNREMKNLENMFAAIAK